MTTETVASLTAEFREIFRESEVATEGSVTYVRIPAVHLPRGCTPKETAVLVVLDPSQEKPDLLLRTKPRRPDGGEPRNVNPVTKLGEAWYQYSFNLAWDPSRHSAEQFVEGRLRRFALNE